MNPIRVVGLSLLTIAMACSDALGPTRGRTELEAARERWRAQDLHTYAFTLQRACFCGNVHPLYVAVLKDTVAAVLDLETGEPVQRELGETIEGLFTFVRTAIDKPAYRLQVTYDGVKGFPLQIDYDGSAQIADDEITYRISDVHPITPQT